MKPSRFIAIVVGSVVALLGLGLFAGGSALSWAYATQRDGDGYFTTPAHRFASASRAITSEQLDLHTDAGPGTWDPFSNDFAKVRLRVTSRAGGNVFIGIGPEADVDRFLAGVAHDEIDRIDSGRVGRRVILPGAGKFRVTYLPRSGERAPADPNSQPFWVARANGAGTQEMRWSVSSGRWAVVVMNSDGRTGVDVDAKLGVRIAGSGAIAIGLLLGGLATLLAAVGLIVFGAHGAHSTPTSRGGVGALGTPGAPEPRDVPAVTDLAGSTSFSTPLANAFPAQLEMAMDPQLKRWTWLVKWFLAIPHFILLAFLWVAFSVLTFVAGVVILFTGRYPRRIFDFNVGVMRWTWRVLAYATNPLCTDEYPPFTLGETDHPARLQVPYPTQLSRWLVLVKWWLLILPHFLIVGVLTTDWAWTRGNGSSGAVLGGRSLLGLLVFIAMIALLITKQYPHGLFNLIMGLDRWIFRVIVYAGLMTDTYPPFRLDMGATEPTASSALLAGDHT